jgi:hypothetical protein
MHINVEISNALTQDSENREVPHDPPKLCLLQIRGGLVIRDLEAHL